MNILAKLVGIILLGWGCIGFFYIHNMFSDDSIAPETQAVALILWIIVFMVPMGIGAIIVRK